MNRAHTGRTLLLAMALAPLAACADGAPDTPPRQITSSPFHYPEELWDAGVEGETVLEIHVSELGTVDSATVQKSSGFAAFDSAAMNGVADLRFDPARRGEDSVPVTVLLPVQFHLPGGDSTMTPSTGTP